MATSKHWERREDGSVKLVMAQQSDGKGLLTARRRSDDGAVKGRCGEVSNKGVVADSA
ncbi:hypothetical protein TIFTF001_044892 [Ficus carica]|uniref:Uncharacterized protein n=1 Tax=Ficus carica TaxID=3494 RepID=A0AA87ZVT4_FICCA|nr:hypothetical protein TIFTF001_044892 [Ficus carica]